jgi:starch-binding outer membrane protein, SusD/RagB family
MKSYKFYLNTTLGVALFMAAGCSEKEFFEISNPPQSIIQTVEDMNRAVAGAYYAITGSEGNRSNFDAHMVFANAIGDETRFVLNAGNDNSVLDLYNRNNAIDNGILNTAFVPSYTSIASINEWLPVLKSGALNQLPGNNRLPIFEGELLFLRAYNYFLLTKMFCPPYEAGGANNGQFIPLRLASTQSISQANAPAAATGEIYNAIVADLVAAKGLLRDTVIAPGRANRFAASALLARVYLHMGRFADAEAECNIVIDQNRGRYDLSQDPIETWNKGWDGAGAKELIWFYATGNGTQPPNGLGGSSSNWKLPRRFALFNFAVPSNNTNLPGGGISGITAGSRTLAVSYSILARVGWMNPADSTPTQAARNDKRFTQLMQYNAGADPTFATVGRKHYWINKFYRGPVTANRIGAIPLLKLSEAYLTRSLLRFRRGDAAGAAADLNVIRKRAWDATAGGGPYVDLNADQVTEDLIAAERWKELALEGDRVHYLQALKQAIPNGDRNANSIAFNDPSLFFLVPLSERELNQGLRNP